MKKRIEYPMGSVSSGTMRPEDLIPDFVYTLRTLAKKHKNQAHLEMVDMIEAHMSADDYFDTEEADYDLNELLFDALNEYSAPYFYFGAHPGDGSDYGWWLSEFFPDDFDGLKVSDLSEVPKDYAGEIVLVNDHGNTSLYTKARTQEPREIWAIV